MNNFVYFLSAAVALCFFKNYQMIFEPFLVMSLYPDLLPAQKAVDVFHAYDADGGWDETMSINLWVRHLLFNDMYFVEKTSIS